MGVEEGSEDAVRLFIDLRWFQEAVVNALAEGAGEGAGAGWGNLGGVGRYVAEVVPRLAARLPEASCTVGVSARTPAADACARLWPGATVVPLPRRWRPGWPRWAGPVSGIWLQACTSRALRGLSLDLFLSPHQLVVPSTRWARHHLVVCHDLAFLQAPHLFFPGGRVPWAYRVHYARLAKAEHLVAVSQRTADALVGLLGVPRERITVVPEGVAHAFVPHGPRWEPGWPYALCVGSAGPGKNVPVIIEGWQRARDSGLDLHLVLSGLDEGRWAALVARHGLSPHLVHRVAPREDAELAAVYRGARMLLMPSLVEGFGLPCLEAMACGCPVVTSVGSPMADWGGEAALLVDPHSPTQLAEAMVRLERDPATRALAVTRGLEVASGFTWEHTADVLASLMGRIAQRG